MLLSPPPRSSDSLGLGMMFNAQLGMTQTTGGQPSQLARADIPALYYLHYRQAGDKYGIDWAVLAAIGKVETDHGRLKAPGVTSGVNSYGCCAGPMQFMVTPRPSTWDAYGEGGDVYDPRDAIPAAARYLKAAGAPDDYQRAIFAYNHAGWYVTKVLDQAAAYRAAPEIPAGGAVAGSPKYIIDTVVLPIARSCGVPATVAANDAAERRAQALTSSGYPSDHKGPPGSGVGGRHEQRRISDSGNGLPRRQARRPVRVRLEMGRVRARRPHPGRVCASN